MSVNLDSVFSELFNGAYPRWERSKCGISHDRHRSCESGYVYIARGADDTVKIGYTSSVDGIQNRLDSVRKQYNMGFTLLFALRTSCALGLERKIHRTLRHHAVKGSGGRELFKVTDRHISAISQIKDFADKPVERLAAIELL